MQRRPPHAFRTATLWKSLSGCLIAAFMFGLPLADALPALSLVPVAHAQQETPGGISSQPQPALCGGPVGAVSITCTDWGQYQLTIARIQRQIDHQLMMAAFVSALNAMTFFSQTIAYDTAEWVASGFEGQAPGIFTDQWDTYLSRLALDSAGEFIDSFSNEFTESAFGLDLCRPPNFPQIALEFQLGIPGLLGEVPRPRTECSWTTLTQNWERAAQSLDNAGSLENIRANFTTGGNDISFGIGAHLAFFDFVATQREAGIQERLEGQGYKSVTNFITGEIQTPADLVRESVNYDLVEFQGQSQQTQANILLSNAWNVGIPQLGILTASTFTNVLLSRLLNKLASGLFKSSGTATANLLDPFAAPPGSVNPDRIFSSQFSDLLTPRVIQTEAQDLLTELVACPTQGRTKWNCALEEYFASAIRQGGGLTVRQAVNQGFLSPEWKLIPSTQARDNQDPSCRLRAFCASNLRKLRLARVLPVGWELAADSPANQLRCTSSDGCVTLGEAINRFDDCNAEGQLDAEHPFCHLIDPNWVLTVLPAQCQVSGYGNQLVAGTSQRLPECQDTTTCLRRDASGKCVGGYGYCMAEQTFWQFEAPMCEAQFASCRTYTPRGPSARPVSYLRSTLDYGSCDATNVGCMWYALYRDADPNEPDGWDAGATPAVRADGTSMDRIYFDATVEPCDAGGDGCTALLRVVPGQAALNLVRNGSFETIDGDPGFPVGWAPVAGNAPAYVAREPASGAPAIHGRNALYPAPSEGGDITTERFALAPLRQYTVSFFARRFTNAPQRTAIEVRELDVTGEPLPANAGGTTYFRSVGCEGIGGDAGVSVPIDPELGESWTRMSCSFVSTEETQQAQVIIRAGASDAATPLIDAVQLEEAEVMSPFIDGLNTALTQVNMKVPPAELQCGGDRSTDHPLCANYAQACRQNEAGCQGYRPAEGGDLTEVPAVLTPADLCPAACVGYAEYRKQASTFDLVRNPDTRLDDPEDVTSAFFVPSTAFSCSAQDVGCEVFTNLNADQGGASEQAYRYLRACELPGSDSQTYYTWEGSDTSGYQLKTWSLKRDTAAPLPQGPKILERAGPDGRLKDPASCSAATYQQALDPDCRQFYDPEGNVFYRFESQTVLSSSTCIQLRKEGSTQADCQKTGGTFNAATSQCMYRADPGNSVQCDATYAGCRAYVGTQGRAQEEVFYEEFVADDFRVVTTFGDLAASPTTVALSDEALLVGDSSMRVQTSSAVATVYAGPMPLMEDALYEVTFWARIANPAGAELSLRGLDGSPLSENGSVRLGADWRTYRLGPVRLPADVVAEGRLPLRIEGASVAFIDKLRVERVQDIAYVVKDSWNTPAICDRTPEGVPSPQAMLGCRAYVDRDGNEVAVRQFTRLCRETAIGCTAFVNTRNTPDPYVQTWEATPAPAGLNPEQTMATADRYEYYIEDQAFFCREEQLGCRAFGRPNYTQDRLALNPDDPFTTVYFKDNPAAYDDALCSERELFCDAFEYATDKQSGVSYFRAPNDHACEYRKAAVVDPTSIPDEDGDGVPDFDTAGRTYDGWFRVGTDIPCHPDFLQSGSVFGIRFTGDIGYNAWADEDNIDGTPPIYDSDAGYRGWTGTCPQEAAECTELRDVNDTSDPLYPTGRPYYVVNNTLLDTQSCNNRVDPGDGCVLFRDTSEPNVFYSTVATYHLYQTRAYQPVDPVDCVGQPAHPSCVATGSAGINNANTVIRVKPDRACSAWLACSTAETVFDPQDGTYKSICADLALCSQAGAPEGASVPFCANYIDRSDSDETILTQYSVLSAAHYASRPVGFGAQDYSGVTIPDHFQVMDTELVPIGAMLSQDPETQSRLAKDYRLAVGVPIENTGPGQQLIWRYGAGPVASVGGAMVGRVASFGDLAPYACAYKPPGVPTFIPPTDNEVSFGIMTDNARNLSTNGELCWLSVNQVRPANLADTGGAALVSDNLNVLSLIRRLEQAVQLEAGTGSPVGQAVDRSFPGAQCKAAPEADSPFDNRFVLEWDGTVTPPAPSRVRDGYRSTHFCEFGEDCSCSYKRVSYGGPSKFYEPLSADVVNAVCVGGLRNGQACVLHAGIAGSIPTGSVQFGEGGEDGEGTGQIDLAALRFGESLNRSQPDPCGGGGVCRPIQDVRLVRGVTGQCLQYDLSRPLVGSRSEYECLVWDPNPLFSGPSDPYHWIPTAGFQPPQTSGRYYCISPFRPPQNIQFSPETKIGFSNNDLSFTTPAVGFKKNDAETWAGQIRNFWYSDRWASDGSCDPGLAATILTGGLSDAIAAISGCDGGEGNGSLDGARANGTDMGRWCEEADDEGLGSANDFKAVRLITTGKGSGRGYAEYAVLADWLQVGQIIAGYPADAAEGLVDPDIAKEYALEDAIAGFTFETPGLKLGCAYSPDWVDGINVSDYDEPDIVRQQDGAWVAGFRQELARNGGRLDRRNAQIVTEDGSPNGIPVQAECLDPENSADTGRCYLKTWTLDYRAEGQTKFQAFRPEISRQSLQSLSKAPVYGKCESSHSWFSIRAVFENTNTRENNKLPEEVRPETLVGPFRFVGFWVTACSPQSGPRYIYTRVNLDTADICRELAETISKDSADTTAFTDRNWAFGSFAIPKLGYQWESTNVPFGASLATRTAGEDPLYMSGVRQDQSNTLRPPTFTFSGQTYFRGEEYPRSNWGILSNIFARIYRIYAYNAREVTRADWACTNEESPNFGQWCPNLDASGLTGTERGDVAKQYCGYESECIPVGLSGSTIFSDRVCNSFSGVNRGLDCSTDPDICHAGPATLRLDGVLVSQYTACEAQGSWESLDNGRRWRCTPGAGCPSACEGDAGCGRNTAVDEGAFRCAADSALAPEPPPGFTGDWEASRNNLSYCTRPQDISTECPKYEVVQCVDENGNAMSGGSGETGVCQGYPWAQCRDAADCTFEARHYWPAGGVVNNRMNIRGGSDDAKYLPQFSGESGWSIDNADPKLMYYVTNGEFPDLDTECDSVDPNVCLIRQAFTPARPGGGKGEGGDNILDSEASLFFARRLNEDDRGVETATLYPGFVPLIRDIRHGDRYNWRDHLEASNISQPPFIQYGSAWDGTDEPGTCESRTVPTGRPGGTRTVNECAGGVFDNDFYTRTCSSDADCVLDEPVCIRRTSSGGRGGTQSSGECLGGGRHGEYCSSNTQCQSNDIAISGDLFAHYAACEPRALMLTPNAGPVGRIGLCRGGVRAGAVCYGEQDCIPENVNRDGAANWCNPVTSGPGGSDAEGYGYTQESAACWPSGPASDNSNVPNRPFLQGDPGLDNNICTRPAGYWPRANLCQDPTDEYCGLLGYDLRNPAASVNDDAPLPTDVTAGLYTPAFPRLGGTNISTNTADYTYADYYSPTPPTIAAPDMRTCQGGTCKISELGSFSIDTVNEGLVNGGAGNHIAAIRFYAWASHEQMPLRRLVIDWGDGQQTELPDAFLKNHKPYCQGQKECVLGSTATGLTCQSDADCPPGAGQCLTRGSCASGPNAGQACVRDRECDSSAGGDGICQPRLFFGNDGGACEEQFFEFRHVYTCSEQAQPGASCSSANRCSGDQTRTCSDASDCAPGDTCVENMVQTDGCFNESASSCQFTPRILLVDNWGWCAGECRAAIAGRCSGNQAQACSTASQCPSGQTCVGTVVDAANARILHPNGGCYDASRLRSNVDLSPLNMNECAENFPNGGTARPWIIFRGSIQVRVGVTE